MKRQAGITYHQGLSIKAALKRGSITQAAVAEGAGLGKAAVGLWLQGKIGSDRIMASLRNLLPDWCSAHLPLVCSPVDAVSSANSEAAIITG